jgi:hypothetical protein
MLFRDSGRHRRLPHDPGRHQGRKRTPARSRRIAALTATAWVAVVTALAGLLVTGASSRTMVTAAPGSSARAAASTAVPEAGTRLAVTQTEQAIRLRILSRAGQSRAHHEAAGMSWTVRPGQTLSGIAGSWCGASEDWTGLYAVNKAVIGGNPDLIMPGQRYSRGCYQGRAPPASALSSSPSHRSSDGRIWGISWGYPNYCGDGDGDGWDVSCASRGASATATATAQSRESDATARPADSPGSGSGSGHHRHHHYYSSAGTYRGSSSYEQCVISRESGGNSQVMNSSGHYGLYQFSESTWEAYGGSAADFGHASAAEQHRIFANAMAQGGQSNWSPYDGC